MTPALLLLEYPYLTFTRQWRTLNVHRRPKRASDMTSCPIQFPSLYKPSFHLSCNVTLRAISLQPLCFLMESIGSSTLGIFIHKNRWKPFVNFHFTILHNFALVHHKIIPIKYIKLYRTLNFISLRLQHNHFWIPFCLNIFYFLFLNQVKDDWENILWSKS